MHFARTARTARTATHAWVWLQRRQPSHWAHMHCVGMVAKRVPSMHVQVRLRVDGLLWRLRLRRRGHVRVQPAARHVRTEQGGQPLQARLRGQLRRNGRGGGGGSGGVTNAWSATRLVAASALGLGAVLPM